MIVILSNSHNGHILADQIIPPHIDIPHVLNYFFTKFALFARSLDELGGELNNHGQKAHPQPSNEEQRDKNDLITQESTVSDGEVQADPRNNSITPFQITLKPSGFN